MDASPSVRFILKGFFLNEMINKKMLVNIGLMIKAYNPAPDIAAQIARLPPAHWMPKALYATNLNSLFLNRRAFGTILADPLDEEEIACLLLRLEEDPVFHDEQVKYGLQRSRLFSWNHTAKELLQVYTNIFQSLKEWVSLHSNIRSRRTIN